MKKILLLVVCCLCLCGCGSKEKKSLDINSVKDSLTHISKVDDVCIVTEDNDPNGQLNKAGGYTDALFFTYGDIEYNSDKNACELGTDAGGSIEIYANNDDAKKRNDYLSSFDGSILSSYHQVEENIVVRISNSLTASEQKSLYEQVIREIQSTN